MKVSGYSSLRSTGIREEWWVTRIHLGERMVSKKSERRTSRSRGTVKISQSGGDPTTTSKVSMGCEAGMLGVEYGEWSGLVVVDGNRREDAGLSGGSLAELSVVCAGSEGESDASSSQ